MTLLFALKWLSRHSRQCNLIFSRLSLRLPVLGTFKSKAFMARYCRTLATCVAAGIPLLTSLKTSMRSRYSAYHQQALIKIYQDTSAGMPLYLAMRHSDAFCEMTLQMIMIGEESGQLDEMLNRVATLYETQLDDDVDKLDTILEPFLIIVLSIIVASLVLAIYLPIFNLMNVIG